MNPLRILSRRSPHKRASRRFTNVEVAKQVFEVANLLDMRYESTKDLIFMLKVSPVFNGISEDVMYRRIKEARIFNDWFESTYPDEELM